MAIASRDEGVIKNILSCTDRLWWIESGGNRLYRLKDDQPRFFHIFDLPLGVYATHETYNYLGHKFIIAGEWNQHVNVMAHQFMTRLDLIRAAPLHVPFKRQAM